MFQALGFYHHLLLLVIFQSHVGLSWVLWPSLPNASPLVHRASNPPTNATGKAIIHGYDVSRRFPGTPDDSGDWNLLMKVTNDAVDSSGGHIIYTDVSFSGPDYLARGQMDPSWFICLFAYINPDLRNDTHGGSFDPSCKGILSNDCLEALNSSSTGRGECSTMNRRNLAGCDGLEQYTGFLDINRDYLGNRSTLSSAAPSINNGPHKPDNFTEYDNAIRQIYVIVTSWNLNTSTSHEGQQTSLKNGVTCLAVDSIEQGSRTFEAAAVRVGNVGAVSLLLPLALSVLGLIV